MTTEQQSRTGYRTATPGASFEEGPSPVRRTTVRRMAWSRRASAPAAIAPMAPPSPCRSARTDGWTWPIARRATSPGVTAMAIGSLRTGGTRLLFPYGVRARGYGGDTTSKSLSMGFSWSKDRDSDEARPVPGADVGLRLNHRRFRRTDRLGKQKARRKPGLFRSQMVPPGGIETHDLSLTKDALYH